MTGTPATDGLVDLHAHGALGFDFATASADDARRAAAFHRSRGTTTLVASIATGSPDATTGALARLAPLVADGTLGGLHLEGPWLAPARRGAHAADLLRTPDAALFEDFLTASAGTLRMLTIAPELPGAEAVVERAAAAGVVVAIGHTDCDAATASRAIDAGARVMTHLFNGMPPLHHRAPGPVGVALADDRVVVELIVDGHHLDPVTVNAVRRAAPGRIALVSDAMAATGCPDGAYRIAGSEVVVRDGVAMLADGSSLAGSTITASDAVARFRACGASDQEARLASITTPATILGSPPAQTGGAPTVGVPAGAEPSLSPPARPDRRWRVAPEPAAWPQTANRGRSGS
jgi:N-acetylglucosamine-6-phosphate deacetylase